MTASGLLPEKAVSQYMSPGVGQHRVQSAVVNVRSRDLETVDQPAFWSVAT
jgi:hypothetical protein